VAVGSGAGAEKLNLLLIYPFGIGPLEGGGGGGVRASGWWVAAPDLVGPMTSTRR
jgi:hypothetical protein